MRLFALHVVLSLLLVAPLASAQGPEDEEARREALELYRQSRERYDVADYEGAVALLEEAHARYPEPVLLYNLARAHENLGQMLQAIDAYERYLESSPDARDGDMIRARIASHRARVSRIEEERPVAPPVTAPPPASFEPAPWVLAGVGAGVLVVGAVFGGLSVAERDAAESEPGFLSAQAASDRAVAFAWVANGSFAVGGVVSLVGLAWGVVQLLVGPPPTPEAVARRSTRGVSLSW